MTVVAIVVAVGNLTLEGSPISSPFSLASRNPETNATGQAETLTLHLSDVLPFSRDFQLQSETSGPLKTPQAQARWTNPSSSQYQQWGRTEGYQTTFRRLQFSENATAPIEVYSRVDLFRDIQGAQQAFQEESRQRKQGKTIALSLVDLADAQVAYTATNGPFIQYLVLFQKGSALAQLLLTGYGGRLPQEAAIDLANLMSKRMGILSGSP